MLLPICGGVISASFGADNLLNIGRALEKQSAP
jgi:hypothetical protein